MNKIKIIFTQTLMISTAILFGIGIGNALSFFIKGTASFNWQWYIPLSITLSGFLCSLPTVFILSLDQLNTKAMWMRIFLHFICVAVIVVGCGYFFHWYDSLAGLIPILINYIIIYVFVWAATAWMGKTDEKKINEAIRDYQDEE